MCPRQELNLDLELRRFSFYPLNYEDNIMTAIISRGRPINPALSYNNIRLLTTGKGKNSFDKALPLA